MTEPLNITAEPLVESSDTNNLPTIADIFKGGSAKQLLKIPAVFRGCDIISNSVAKIGFDVYKRLPDGSRAVDDKHTLQKLLKQRPNSLYTPYALIKGWVLNALTHGDGYIFIKKDSFGNPTELVLMNPECTSIIYEKGVITYASANDRGEYERLSSSQVAHLRFNSSDGICGNPVYRTLADAFGLSANLQRFQNAFFDNGGKLSYVIILPEEITNEEIEEFRKGFSEIHSGTGNSFRPAMVRPGTDIKTLGNDNSISALKELREHDLITVANCMGFNHTKLDRKQTHLINH